MSHETPLSRESTGNREERESVLGLKGHEILHSNSKDILKSNMRSLWRMFNWKSQQEPLILSVSREVREKEDELSTITIRVHFWKIHQKLQKD